MVIDIDEKNLKHGVLGLVIALVEIIRDTLKLQALKRVEGGSLSAEEEARLGQALMELETAIEEIKCEQGITESVRAVREGLDNLVDDVIDQFLNPQRWYQAAKAVEKSSLPETAQDKTEQRGRYLYCIADSGELANLGPIGIEENNVDTIPYHDICAVEHEYVAVLPLSQNREVAKSWLLAYQRVVDEAWTRWGTVLPLAFGTMVTDKNGLGAEENVKSWLQSNYDNLKNKLAKVRGKVEYGVQVFWEPQIVARSLIKTSPEISRLEEEIKSRSGGLAFLYRQKLENVLKRELEVEAKRCFRDFYERIRQYADEIVVEKTKPTAPNQCMLLNLSCLLPKGKAAELGEELEGINHIEGFSVRFTGPWPPYSFVGI